MCFRTPLIERNKFTVNETGRAALNIVKLLADVDMTRVTVCRVQTVHYNSAVVASYRLELAV